LVEKLLHLLILTTIMGL